LLQILRGWLFVIKLYFTSQKGGKREEEKKVGGWGIIGGGLIGLEWARSTVGGIIGGIKGREK
jgi:hypothetical protein